MRGLSEVRRRPRLDRRATPHPSGFACHLLPQGEKDKTPAFTSARSNPAKSHASASRSSSSPRPTSRLPHPAPRPVAGEGSLGRRIEAAAGAERTGVLSDRQSSFARAGQGNTRSEEHTSELQSREKLVCRLLLEKK